MKLNFAFAVFNIYGGFKFSAIFIIHGAFKSCVAL